MPEFSEKEIEDMINRKEKEDLKLDYKYEITKDDTEIAKDVSSFANTSGGTIIYGINDNNWTIQQTSTDFRLLEQRFVNIARDKISPRIQIFPYEKMVLGNKLFVVDVPQSLLAPHFVNNHKTFYHRVGSHNNPYNVVEMNESLIEQKYKERIILSTNIENNIKEKLKLIWISRGQGYCFLAIPAFLRDVKNLNRNFWDASIFSTAGRPRYKNFHFDNFEIRTDFYGFYFDDTQNQQKFQSHYDGCISLRSSIIGNTISLYTIAINLVDFIRLTKIFYKKVGFEGKIKFVISINECKDVNFISDDSLGGPRYCKLENLVEDYIHDSIIVDDINREETFGISNRILEIFLMWLNEIYKNSKTECDIKTHIEHINKNGLDN